MKPWLIGLVALVFAGSTGFLAATALSTGSQVPTKTVTIDVGTGAQGLPGPAGPPGPKGEPGTPGAESCPAGSTFSAVLVNAPKGQTILYACVKD